jgi:hypothetical protein
MVIEDKEDRGATGGVMVIEDKRRQRSYRYTGNVLSG